MSGGRYEPVIETGYRPGVIGRVAQLHAEYYSRAVGFGHAFEAKVATELADFCGRLGRPENEIWTVCLGGAVHGSLAIDGEDLGDGRAHLRWFILDEATRGLGLGRRLLDLAVAHCDARGVQETHLWTFQGLDAARYLYERAGFELADQAPGETWGRTVVEQRFVRARRVPRTSVPKNVVGDRGLGSQP